MRIAFFLPLYVREESKYLNEDINSFNNFLQSFQGCEDGILIIYNGGCLISSIIHNIMKHYDIKYEIIGRRNNIEIEKAREEGLDYIWDKYPNIPYIGEVHRDMIFYKEWYKPLINYLDSHLEEPMICPAVINGKGEYSMDEGRVFRVPKGINEMMSFLESVKINSLKEGFSSPLIHRSEFLKEITKEYKEFFKENLGCEESSLIIKYSCYLGLREKWKPKIYGMATVYNGYDHIEV